MKKVKKQSNGQGSIYRDTSGAWRAEIQWKDPTTGKTNRKSWKSNKQAVVKEKLNEFKKKLLLNNGEWNQDTTTFQDFSEYWVQNILRPQIKPSSFARKIDTLNHQVYPHIGYIPISKLKHIDIQNMVNILHGEGLSYSTIKKAFEAVTGCLRYYRVYTQTSFNPCEGVSLPMNIPKKAMGIHFFNDIQRKQFCMAATEKYANGKPIFRLGWIYIIMLYTGVRPGELCGLTWDNIDFQNRTISIDKIAVENPIKDKDGISHRPLTIQNNAKTEHSIRTIPMTQKAYEALIELKKITGNEKFLVTSLNHKPIRPTRINATFHRILKAAGIEKGEGAFGVHTLRHTFATMLFNNGCEVKVVSELLGHCNTKVTENTYIHLIQQSKTKAIKTIDNYCD